ncbi:hypothetical protein GPK77_06560 [Butyricicoccus faecihominis]|nr:hypothetical protein [Butyricicoccus faecihominis]MBT9817385.1 hypothetical protein [Butyricicoccus faecihominis]
MTEMKATTKGQIRWYVSMREPDGSVLHGENVGKLVTAKSIKAEVVIKATESIIRENGERVLEWLRAGRLKEATPELLLLALPEESIERVYGKSDEEHRELVRQVVKLLPPISELQEKMETVTLRAVEKVVAVKEKGSVVKRALNRLYDEAVAQGILQENNVKKLLVTVRSEGEKADKNINQRALSLEEMRMLTALCIEGMQTDIRYASVLLHLTTGVKTGELCGLNIDNLMRYKDAVYIEIGAKSVQSRGKVAEWKPYERESGKLRRIPCTPLAQAALSVLLKPRLEAGAKVDAPLIVGEGGRRWDVLKLRAFEKEVLQKVVLEYAKISRTDVIRTSFEHYCRVICGMSDGSAQKLLGCKAAQTYEEWYCDYSSKVALMTLEAQLRRCHKSLICDEGKWHIAAHLHLRMKRGASVQIQTEHGVKIEKI